MKRSLNGAPPACRGDEPRQVEDQMIEIGVINA
jgi:hypothetical protein